MPDRPDIPSAGDAFDGRRRQPPRATQARFDTTDWTLILQGARDREGVDRFIRTYWSPIYAYIRRRGHQSQDAADLTQEFLTRVVLQRGLLQRADQARGRFRSYLLAALEHFLIDAARAERSAGGAHVRYVPQDASLWAAIDPREDDPALAFDRQWAVAVLHEALARLERACRAEGMEEHWELFRQRILDPAVRPAQPPARVQLAPADPQQVSNMVGSVKRKFQRIFRQVVAETVTSREDLESELSMLNKLLG